MQKFTVGDLNNRIDDITEAAGREPVVLTRDNKPTFVLMSVDQYSRLIADGEPRSAHLTSEMPAEHVELLGAELTSLAGLLVSRERCEAGSNLPTISTISSERNHVRGRN